MNLSVVIPAHNEEEGVRPTIERLHGVLIGAGIPFEILIVNDHSIDRTEQVLHELSVELPGVRYVNNQKQRGFGYAIQTGLENFTGDAVCIVMADASDDPRDVVAYYRKLEEGYECVFGSRFTRQSKVIDYPKHKLYINRLANWFINILFHLHFNDTTNAFKAYRREVIQGVMPILSSHFNITVELPLKAITRGYSFVTIPINWYNRATGVSKLKIKEMGSRYLFIVLYVWLEHRLSRGDYRRPAAPLSASHELVSVAAVHPASYGQGSPTSLSLTTTLGGNRTATLERLAQGRVRAEANSPGDVGDGALLVAQVSISSRPRVSAAQAEVWRGEDTGDAGVLGKGVGSSDAEGRSVAVSQAVPTGLGGIVNAKTSHPVPHETDTSGDRQDAGRSGPLDAEHVEQSGRQVSEARQSLGKRLVSLAGASVVAIPLVMLGLIIMGIWTRTPHVPFWDEWETVSIVHGFNDGSLTFGQIWAFHNEHRIVLPRLINLALILATNWNRQIEMTFDLAVTAGELVLLWLSIRRLVKSRLAAMLSVLPLSLLQLSLSQYENWLAPFQITFIATATGVAMCLWGLLASDSRLRFVVALLGAIIAALSSLGGTLAFVAFLPAVIAQGSKKTIVWIGAAVCILVPYFSGFPHSVPLHLTWQTVKFILGYMGAPVGYPNVRASIYIGTGSVVLVAFNVVVLLARRNIQQLLPWALPWLGVVLYSWGVACITAFGRLDLGGIVGLETSRYQVFSVLWWVFVVALVLRNLVDTVEHSSRPEGSRQAIRQLGMISGNSLVLASIVFGLVLVNINSLPNLVWFQYGRLQNEACIMNSTYASSLCLDMFYPIPAVVQARAQYLKGERYGIFNGQYSQYVKPAPNPPAHALVRYFKYSSTAPDYWTTVTYKINSYSGYRPELVQGYIYDTEQPGTVPLYSCVREVNQQADHFLSLDANCGGASRLELEGWLLKEPSSQVQSIPLYTCLGGNDHFVSSDAHCEGQTVLYPIGYALTEP